MQNNNKKHRLLHSQSGGMCAELFAFIRIVRKRAQECLSCETYVLTSKGEMQGTIYSGEKIQSFACCSAVIKQDSKECTTCVAFSTQLLYFRY
jgi:hypothetical protein